MVRPAGRCTTEVKSAEACTAEVRSAEAPTAVAKSAEACAKAMAAWRAKRRALRAVGWSKLSAVSGLVGVRRACGPPMFVLSVSLSVYALAIVRGRKAV